MSSVGIGVAIVVVMIIVIVVGETGLNVATLWTGDDVIRVSVISIGATACFEETC